MVVERQRVLEGAGWELIGAQSRTGRRAGAQFGFAILRQQRGGSVLGERRKRLLYGVGRAECRCLRGLQRRGLVEQ